MNPVSESTVAKKKKQSAFSSAVGRKKVRKVIYKKRSSTGRTIKKGQSVKETSVKYSASEPYQNLLDERLKDPEEAARYLNASIDEDDPGLFLLALKDVIHARESIASIAEKTKLNREGLYGMLSRKGNPSLSSLDAILHALGFRLTIAVK